MNTNHQPTESTALLADTQRPSANRISSLPPVYPLDIRPISGPNDPSISRVFPTAAAKTAFELIALLQSFVNEKEKRLPSHDVWDRWSKESDVLYRLRELEHRVLDTWSEFLKDYRSPQEIEELLWLEFPAEEGSLRRLRGTLLSTS
jgi:hypothetical protein